MNDGIQQVVARVEADAGLQPRHVEQIDEHERRAALRREQERLHLGDELGVGQATPDTDGGPHGIQMKYSEGSIP